MIFSTNLKNIKPDFAFDLGGVSIAPVDTHKYLGITFSSDCKWYKDVDTLIEKTSKQVNAFRKLKFKLKREYLEKINLTFIRTILDYSSEVWDNCGQINVNRLEKIEAAGIHSYRYTLLCRSKLYIYCETGWDKLSV